MISLLEFLNEGKSSPEKQFEEFAEKRKGGATKIADNAKEKGGVSMLTYHHFVVKLPYYKKAAEGKLDLVIELDEETEIEFFTLCKN